MKCVVFLHSSLANLLILHRRHCLHCVIAFIVPLPSCGHCLPYAVVVPRFHSLTERGTSCCLPTQEQDCQKQLHRADVFQRSLRAVMQLVVLCISESLTYPV